MSDPRFYNPDNKPITITDQVEFEQMIRTITPNKLNKKGK